MSIFKSDVLVHILTSGNVGNSLTMNSQILNLYTIAIIIFFSSNISKDAAALNNPDTSIFRQRKSLPLEDLK